MSVNDVEIEIKKISSKAIFLDKKHFMNTSPLKTMFDNFDYHVSIEFVPVYDGNSAYIQLDETAFYRNMIKFGKEHFTGKYFSVMILDWAENVIDPSYRRDYHRTYPYTCIFFMSKESDRDLFLKEWAIIEKLSTP